MDTSTKVSSYNIIAKVHRDFKIPDTGWYNDGIEWIHDALMEIGTKEVLVHKSISRKVLEGKVLLPCTLDLFLGVQYNDCFLDRVDKVVEKENNYGIGTKYQILGPYILVDLPDDTEIVLHYKNFAVDGSGYPMIPNMQSVRQALEWKLMLMLLQSGMYQHTIISYEFADGRYRHFRDLACNDLLQVSPEEIDEINRDWRSIAPTFDNKLSIYES